MLFLSFPRVKNWAISASGSIEWNNSEPSSQYVYERCCTAVFRHQITFSVAFNAKDACRLPDFPAIAALLEAVVTGAVVLFVVVSVDVTLFVMKK